MENKYKWLLIFPVLTLVLGAYLLLSGEAFLRQVHLQNQEQNLQPEKSQTATRAGSRAGSSLQEDLKSNRDSAYPYFLLGAGFLVALVVLPRLGELSFSPTSGFTLKLLREVKEAIEEVKATTQSVEQKAKQATHTTGSPESLLAPRTDFSPELSKLEANNIRLHAYASLLEKMMEKKRE